MSSSVQFQPASFSRCDFNENPNDGTPNSLENDRANPRIYPLAIPYNEYIQDIFKAALAVDEDRINLLIAHPLFKKNVQAYAHRQPPMTYLIMIGIIEELPKQDLQKIVDHTLQFTKDNPKESDLLPITLIHILKHRSLERASFKEILHWIILLSELPCSDLLSQQLFLNFWHHSSINRASKDELLGCLDKLPNRYKIPFLTRLIEHPYHKPVTLAAITDFMNLFNQHSINLPCSQNDAERFYSALFQSSCMKNVSQDNLTLFLNQTSVVYKTPLLAQIAWHPSLKNTDLPGIKNLIETFNAYYQANPCTELSTFMFYSALFKYGSMSGATTEDLSTFFESAPDPCRALLSRCVLQHQALKLSPENEFSENALQLLKSILFQPLLQQTPREEFFKTFIEPAKGYTRIKFILLILSSESPHSFTLEEFKKLCSLFLEELDPSDHLGLQEGPDVARSYLMSNRIQGLEIQSQSVADEVILDILQKFNSRLKNKAAERGFLRFPYKLT